jgi:hypothetical protein
MKKFCAVLFALLTLPCFAEEGRFGLSDVEFFMGLPYFYEKLNYDGEETLESAFPAFSFGISVVHYGIAGNEALGFFMLAAFDFPPELTHTTGGVTTVFKRADTTAIEAAAGAAYRLVDKGALKLPLLAGLHFFYLSGNSLFSQSVMRDLTQYGFGLFASAGAEFHVNRTLYFFSRVQCALDFVTKTEQTQYTGVNVAENIAYFIGGREFLSTALYVSVMPVIGIGIKLDTLFD